jgi:hypothetical protein
MPSRQSPGKRQRAILFLLLITTGLFTFLAQATSRLNPYLEKSPVLLDMMPTLGTTLCLMLFIVSSSLYLFYKRTVYAFISLLSSIGTLFISISIWGEVFQITVAGLLIVITLLLLLSTPDRFIRKNRL